LNVQKL